MPILTPSQAVRTKAPIVLTPTTAGRPGLALALEVDDFIKELNLRPPAEQFSIQQPQEHLQEQPPEKPFERLPQISTEQRERAEQLYPIAWKIFQRAKRQGKVWEESSGIWSYRGENYALYHSRERDRFSISNRERGELARYEAGKVESAQAIGQQDLETLRRHGEAQQQRELLERQKQEQLREQSTKPKKDTGYER